MSFRERIIRTFKKEKIDRIVWQPRIYFWFYANGLKNKLPSGYEGPGFSGFFAPGGCYLACLRIVEDIPKASEDTTRLPKPMHELSRSIRESYGNKSMIEIYDDLNASPRYPLEVLGVDLFKLEIDKASKIKVKTVTEGQGRRITTLLETPLGNLKEVRMDGYPVEYFVKTLEDIKLMEYVLRNTEFKFDKKAFEIADKEFGERGAIQSFYTHSPFQRLIIDFMGFRKTVFMLYRHANRIKEFLRVNEEWDDRMYKVLLDSPLKVLNFGENIDANLDSPKFFKEYLIPSYEERVKQIHRKNKFCHIHMDGSIKPLLPLLDEIKFDGIEAATPKPQGDVSLKELKEAMGDKILLDGIPAVLFLPEYSKKELKEFAIQVLETFSPNLILGISDELPPNADIEKVRLVSKIVEKYQV